MFQMKEQNHPPGTNPNEMKISHLPDRVQNNDHKDADQTQEKNGGTQ